VWVVALVLLAAGAVAVLQSRASGRTKVHLDQVTRQVRHERSEVDGLNGRMAELSDALARTDVKVTRASALAKANQKRLKAIAGRLDQIEAERTRAEQEAERAAHDQATLTGGVTSLRPG